MRLRTRDVYALAAVLALGAILSGCAASPRARLTQTTDAFATAMDTVANARDAGLITDAQVQQTRPIADAFWAAKGKAEEQIKAGNAGGAQAWLEQAAAALAQLSPLLAEISQKGGK